jgi:hypothetical protein
MKINLKIQISKKYEKKRRLKKYNWKKYKEFRI